jgi:hypothetical protein
MSTNNRCNHYNEDNKSCEKCGKRRFYQGMLSLFCLISIIIIIIFNWPDNFSCKFPYKKDENGKYDYSEHRKCDSDNFHSFLLMLVLCVLSGILTLHRMLSIDKNRPKCSNARKYEEGFEVDGCDYCSPRFSYRLFKVVYEALGRQSINHKLNKKIK